MQIAFYIFLVAATFCFMEGVAWFTHKYIMHGWLWYLHKDHHQPAPGFFEKNDAFFLIFALPSFFLFLFGVKDGLNWMFFVALGIFLYGAAYFIVHDVIIHQRFKWFTRSNNSYVRTIRWAHKMHHKHLGPEDGESFGMLYVARKYWEKVKKDNARQHAI
ncbi:sterol desaturase family protein [uncultured Chitinophaga sp.]|uniref:sterol desaturase family protein n=1 Tax=uncultured Chitinophaga sp. TaxID=339340 RepID=UPI0025E943B3|nr:sterol desaturase family protein [uncultured Chitinophaga sp.]